MTLGVAALLPGVPMEFHDHAPMTYRSAREFQQSLKNMVWALNLKMKVECRRGRVFVRSLAKPGLYGE